MRSGVDAVLFRRILRLAGHSPSNRLLARLSGRKSPQEASIARARCSSRARASGAARRRNNDWILPQDFPHFLRCFHRCRFVGQYSRTGTMRVIQVLSLQ